MQKSMITTDSITNSIGTAMTDTVTAAAIGNEQILVRIDVDSIMNTIRSSMPSNFIIRSSAALNDAVNNFMSVSPVQFDCLTKCEAIDDDNNDDDDDDDGSGAACFTLIGNRCLLSVPVVG